MDYYGFIDFFLIRNRDKNPQCPEMGTFPSDNLPYGFTCPTLFLLVPDKRTIYNFHPCKWADLVRLPQGMDVVFPPEYLGSKGVQRSHSDTHWCGPSDWYPRLISKIKCPLELRQARWSQPIGPLALVRQLSSDNPIQLVRTCKSGLHGRT